MSSTLDWANLFEEEAPRLMRFLRRFGPRISAEDISQDAFAKLCAAKTGEIANPQAYLITIARNLALNELRRRDISPVQLAANAEALDPPSEAPSPEENAIASEEAVRLRAALDALPERQRLALTLFKLEGLTHKEIGVRLNVSHRTVERYIADALASCYQSLSAASKN